MQRGAAGAGGLNGGSPARGGAASAAAGAGGCGGRGWGPGREAEAGAAGAGGGAPEAMMGKEEEIARIARRLDKMVTKKSAEGAMDLLRELKAMPVTLHLLQSTRVGMSVNALRKQSSDEEVVTLAKSLIKSWKKLLGADASDAKARERRRGGPLPTSSSKEASEAQDPRPRGYAGPDCRWAGFWAAVRVEQTGSGGIVAVTLAFLGTGISRSRKRPELPRTPSTPRITTFPPVPVTCDAVRNKCREMLTAALQTDRECLGRGHPAHLGVLAPDTRLIPRWPGPRLPVEARVQPRAADLGGGEPGVSGEQDAWMLRRLSRLSNLKDAKNPSLRRNVLCGAITPQQIAVMTSEVSPWGRWGLPLGGRGLSTRRSPQEMASDELKEIRKAMTKEAIREHQMARTGGTQTDLFTCGKCRKKNCTYTQVQTRSSDEPMTTFVVCNECGNRW
ncbi:hypothetical protein EI555_003576, partial [Monodon monoceros]